MRFTDEMLPEGTVPICINKDLRPEISTTVLLTSLSVHEYNDLRLQPYAAHSLRPIM